MSNLTYDQLIEKVARAMCAHHDADPDEITYQWGSGKGPDYQGPRWVTYEGIARAAIATIAEAIKEQTEAMMEAVDCGGDKKDWLSGRAWKSGYRSMHAASPLYPEGK